MTHALMIWAAVALITIPNCRTGEIEVMKEPRNQEPPPVNKQNDLLKEAQNFQKSVRETNKDKVINEIDGKASVVMKDRKLNIVVKNPKSPLLKETEQEMENNLSMGDKNSVRIASKAENEFKEYIQTAAQEDSNVKEMRQNVEETIRVDIDQFSNSLKEAKMKQPLRKDLAKDATTILENDQENILESAKEFKKSILNELDQIEKEILKRDPKEIMKQKEVKEETPSLVPKEVAQVDPIMEEVLQEISSDLREELADTDETILDEEGIVIYESYFDQEAEENQEDSLEEYKKFIKDTLHSLKKIECSYQWLFEPFPQNRRYKRYMNDEEINIKQLPISIENYNDFIKDTIEFLKNIESNHKWIFEQVQGKDTKIQRSPKSQSITIECFKEFIEKATLSLNEIELNHGWIFNSQRYACQRPEKLIEDYNTFIKDALVNLKAIEEKGQWVFKSSGKQYSKQKPIGKYTFDEYKTFISEILDSLKEIEHRYKWALKPRYPKYPCQDTNSKKTGQAKLTPVSDWSCPSLGDGEVVYCTLYELMVTTALFFLVLFVLYLSHYLHAIEDSVAHVKVHVDLLERNLHKKMENKRNRNPVRQHPDTWDDVPL